MKRDREDEVMGDLAFSAVRRASLLWRKGASPAGLISTHLCHTTGEERGTITQSDGQSAHFDLILDLIHT